MSTLEARHASASERPMSLADALRAGSKRKNAGGAAKKSLAGTSANQSKRSRVTAAATEAAGAAVASLSAMIANGTRNATGNGEPTSTLAANESTGNDETRSFRLPPMPAGLVDALAACIKDGSSFTNSSETAINRAGSSGPSKNTKTAAIAKTLNTSEIAMASSSIAEVVFARQRQWEEHHRELEKLRDRTERIAQQCKTFKRTRRNIKRYNDLLEQHAQCRKELALVEMEEPNLQQFYADLLEFLKQQQLPPPLAVVSAKELKNNSSDGDDEQCVVVDQHVAVANNSSSTVSAASSHRALKTTCGAPILLKSHFDALAMQCNAFSVADTRFNDDDKLFDAAIANDLRAHLRYDSICPILAVLVSPTSTGVAATPPLLANKSLPLQNLSETFRSASASLQQQLQSPAARHNVAGGESDSNGTAKKLIMVTIGKSDRASHGPSGSENRNRLNVKMKEIRNMQNLSIFNYGKVEQRETTKEEEQHERLIGFFSEREAARSASQAPSYDDACCEACKEPLVVDAHTGMVACPNRNCGLAYPDGVDSHRIEPIRHEYHSKFEYLKSGHLMSLLKRFQAKESTVIPTDVINRIARELVDRQGYVITRAIEHNGATVPISALNNAENVSAKRARSGPNITTISVKKLRECLKKLGLSKLYDHCFQIHWILTEIKPHQFSPLEEQEFQACFDEIERVYPLFKPKNAENFIFYWFVIHKTAQLLGHPDHVVDSFPTLKNAKKHLQKEKLWQKMMLHLGWPYYESSRVTF